MAKPPSTHNNDLINKASTLSAQGKDQQALETVERHLTKNPKDPGALNLAGTLAAKLEDWRLAEKYFTQSLALNDKNPYALFTLSKVFKLSQRPGEAINLLTQLIGIEPDNTNAFTELGTLMIQQGYLDAGITALRTAIKLDPSSQTAHHNLYISLYFGGHYEEAVAAAKTALEHIKTDYRWNIRADLIACLTQTRAFAEAKQVAETLISALESTNEARHQAILLSALNNYGLVLLELEDVDAAEAQFHKVIALNPARVDPYTNLARLNGYRENFQEAIHWFEKALEHGPKHAGLHAHLALFMREAGGRPDLALSHLQEAIAIEPSNVEYHYYLGMTNLALGNLSEAYKTWELRWARREGGSKSNLPIPEWTGAPTTSRSLLVYREQGIGDEILFASCLPDLIPRFDKILCVCHSKLKTLFSRSFPHIEFRSGENGLTHADVQAMGGQIAMGSLAPIFRPSLDAFPTTAQLLIPDPKKVQAFRERLLPLRKTLTVGIGWRSGLLSVNRKALYPYLNFWQALLSLPGITWINLQYGEVTEELRQAEELFGTSIINFSDVNHLDDLDTSAALMKACDLVIGPATSTTMISAAVGTPTLRLASGSDPYQLGTDHYPWLPALTPILRPFGASWHEPIAQVAAIVRTLVSEKSA